MKKQYKSSKSGKSK